jgi:ribosome-associated protein
VICHASSDRQALTIADHIEERLARDLGVKPSSIEGRRRAEWILMDYIDFVVHVFLAEKREFYRLERLWGDAPRIEPDAIELPAPQESTTRRTSSA